MIDAGGKGGEIHVSTIGLTLESRLANNHLAERNTGVLVDLGDGGLGEITTRVGEETGTSRVLRSTAMERTSATYKVGIKHGNTDPWL